jgi:GNAT superfamily N-acetyltransferase
MSTSSWRRTVTLRDGARVTLRQIAPEDKPLIAASFERLGEESRYRRFLTSKKDLSAAELDYLVDVDHSDHEAIIAVDQLSEEAVGVARYVRSNDDAEVAEIAVTVIDDWQGRGLGRLLLTRLTDRARREGVRRFSAVVLGQNREALGLFNSFGDVRREYEAGMGDLVIELPPKRGIGARLARVLREVAAGNVLVAQPRVAGDPKIARSMPRRPRAPALKTQRSS